MSNPHEILLKEAYNRGLADAMRFAYDKIIPFLEATINCLAFDEEDIPRKQISNKLEAFIDTMKCEAAIYEAQKIINK